MATGIVGVSNRPFVGNNVKTSSSQTIGRKVLQVSFVALDALKQMVARIFSTAVSLARKSLTVVRQSKSLPVVVGGTLLAGAVYLVYSFSRKAPAEATQVKKTQKESTSQEAQSTPPEVKASDLPSTVVPVSNPTEVDPKITAEYERLLKAADSEDIKSVDVQNAIRDLAEFLKKNCPQPDDQRALNIFKKYLIKGKSKTLMTSIRYALFCVAQTFYRDAAQIFASTRIRKKGLFKNAACWFFYPAEETMNDSRFKFISAVINASDLDKKIKSKLINKMRMTGLNHFEGIANLAYYFWYSTEGKNPGKAQEFLKDARKSKDPIVQQVLQSI